ARAVDAGLAAALGVRLALVAVDGAAVRGGAALAVGASVAAALGVVDARLAVRGAGDLRGAALAAAAVVAAALLAGRASAVVLGTAGDGGRADPAHASVAAAVGVRRASVAVRLAGRAARARHVAAGAGECASGASVSARAAAGAAAVGDCRDRQQRKTEESKGHALLPVSRLVRASRIRAGKRDSMVTFFAPWCRVQCGTKSHLSRRRRGTLPLVSVRIEKSGPVTTVILDRPAVKNAVDRATAEALAGAFRAFDADAEAKVGVLYGDHGTFCAGADLKAIAAGQGNRVEPDGDGPMGPTRMLLGKPVIAAIAGHAVAGGLEL